jgi:hypothetical protein
MLTRLNFASSLRVVMNTFARKPVVDTRFTGIHSLCAAYSLEGQIPSNTAMF